MEKVQKFCALLGIIFIFLYFIYVGGYSTNNFFKFYTLILGLLFLTIDILINIFLYIKNKKQ